MFYAKSNSKEGLILEKKIVRKSKILKITSFPKSENFAIMLGAVALSKS